MSLLFWGFDVRAEVDDFVGQQFEEQSFHVHDAGDGWDAGVGPAEWEEEDDAMSIGEKFKKMWGVSKLFRGLRP